MTRSMKRGAPKPTWTHLVLERLKQEDDFMSHSQLVEATKATICQVSASLSHLRKFKAVDSVVGGDGKLWWFATPETDTRLFTQDERIPEEPGTRKPRRTSRLQPKD